MRSFNGFSAGYPRAKTLAGCGASQIPVRTLRASAKIGAAMTGLLTAKLG